MSIGISGVQSMLEIRTGLNYGDKPSLFDAAINGAILEIGINTTIPQAQSSYSSVIIADTNEIKTAPGYSGRMTLVEYQYSDDSNQAFVIPLEPADIKDISLMNQGQQGRTNDQMRAYAITGIYLRIGPFNSKSGGFINMTWQRDLTLDDIELIPDVMAIVIGAHANMIDAVADPRSYEILRRTFVAKMLSGKLAFQPSMETIKNRAPANQVIEDQLELESFRGRSSWLFLDNYPRRRI